MKNLLFFCLLFLSPLAFSQSSTEVYLFDLKKKGKTYELTNPINISNNKGYDNQPSFFSDGSAVLFASTFDGQTEVVQYQINTKKKSRLTTTSGSEYSPTVMPDGKYFSCILLEKDGRQLLWKYPFSGEKAEVVVPSLVIGYHCWYDQNTVYSFVLGDQFTLQKSTLSTGKNEVFATNIGRSLHRIPKSTAISYIQKDSTAAWQIKQLDVPTGKTKTIIETLEKVEDMAWTAKGVIFMGKGTELYKFNPKKDKNWVKIANLELFQLKGITRLAISPKGNKLAIVVNED